MAFTKTTWVDGSNPAITAAQLNRVEQGIADAHAGNINPGAIGATELASNAVTGPKIAQDAVTASKIADNAVSTAKLPNGAVTEAKLANFAVTTSKIALQSIRNAHVEPASLGEGIFPDRALGARVLATSTTERDWVLARLASTAFGVIGSYAFAKLMSGGASYGDTKAGGDLRPAEAGPNYGSASLSGTWRCMGFSSNNAPTLWLRIS